MFQKFRLYKQTKHKMEGDSQNQTVKVEQTEEIVQATEDVTTAETSAQEKVPSSEGSTNSSEGFVKRMFK